MRRISPTWLHASLLLAAGALAQVPSERTETGPTGDFSITFPDSWRSVPASWGETGQLGLFADDPFDISIVVSSRPLDEQERALDRRQLLDQMIERTMSQTTELGNEIVQVGRVEPLFEDWPAFAAVATTADRSKIITHLRSPVRDRVYTVATLTDNLQGSPELSATVTRVVDSLIVHPPDPGPEPEADAAQR